MDAVGGIRYANTKSVVCNVSFDQCLESDAKWSAFTRAVHEAMETGLAMWLYDERGYAFSVI